MNERYVLPSPSAAGASASNREEPKGRRARSRFHSEPIGTCEGDRVTVRWRLYVSSTAARVRAELVATLITAEKLLLYARTLPFHLFETTAALFMYMIDRRAENTDTPKHNQPGKSNYDEHGSPNVRLHASHASRVMPWGVYTHSTAGRPLRTS
jgi:hypothetical protein